MRCDDLTSSDKCSDDSSHAVSDSSSDARKSAAAYRTRAKVCYTAPWRTASLFICHNRDGLSMPELMSFTPWPNNEHHMNSRDQTVQRGHVWEPCTMHEGYILKLKRASPKILLDYRKTAIQEIRSRRWKLVAERYDVDEEDMEDEEDYRVYRDDLDDEDDEQDEDDEDDYGFNTSPAALHRRWMEAYLARND